MARNRKKLQIHHLLRYVTKYHPMLERLGFMLQQCFFAWDEFMKYVICRTGTWLAPLNALLNVTFFNNCFVLNIRIEKLVKLRKGWKWMSMKYLPSLKTVLIKLCAELIGLTYSTGRIEVIYGVQYSFLFFVICCQSIWNKKCHLRKVGIN